MGELVDAWIEHLRKVAIYLILKAATWVGLGVVIGIGIGYLIWGAS